ncbi:MAG: hypothetical protein HXY50_12120 [Ignavibacteriaceae bacterium]|nr:hypothetical protein [Ignavibacteriaceae bacterium]
MSTKKLLTVFFCFFFLSLTAFAQEEDSLLTFEDSECVSDSEDWDDFDFDWEFETKEFRFHGSPTIALNFGQSKVNLENFSGSFSKPNYPEVKLGYTSLHESKYSEDILRYRFNNIFLGNSFTKTNSSNSSSKDIRTDMWRFGFSWATGYGYDLGQSSIIPYHSTSMAWSRVKFKDALQNPSDAAFAERFNEAFRFGTGAEAGVRFNIIPLISLDLSYERSIIFERHMFWKWAGSGIIEAAAQGMLDHFIKKIGKSSPTALPIVSFVLKSALSYGIYELRQEKMNWPFKSAAPLAYDQFKVGMTFNF